MHSPLGPDHSQSQHSMAPFPAKRQKATSRAFSPQVGIPVGHGGAFNVLGYQPGRIPPPSQPHPQPPSTALQVGIPVGHGEAFNILRYQLGQHYDSHSDAFEQEQYKGTAHFSERSQRVCGVGQYTCVFRHSRVKPAGE